MIKIANFFIKNGAPTETALALSKKNSIEFQVQLKRLMRMPIERLHQCGRCSFIRLEIKFYLYDTMLLNFNFFFRNFKV